MTRATSLTPQKTEKLDPLFVIFEQHLCNFQDPDVDRRTFIGNVVKDYLTHLRKMNIIVPKSLEGPVIEEIGAQVHTMLVKKIYGCLSIQDYQRRLPLKARKQAKTQYARLTTLKRVA